MRYGEGDRESENVEDRRGSGGGFPRGGFPGGGIRIPFGGGGFSFGTIILIGIVCLMLGINPLTLLTGGGLEIPNMPRPDRQGAPAGHAGSAGPARRRRQQRRKSPVHSPRAGRHRGCLGPDLQGRRPSVRKPALVLFTGATRTACGTGQSAMGPFYCPADQKVYIDLAFYDELKRRFRAPGDFAQAYVIAHEVGHHVQTLLGIADSVQALKQNARSEGQANQLQVRMELQADCFAGVWASLNHQMKNRLQPGDIESGLTAAAAIGDDRLQKQTQGYAVPESFTHGSSEQRVRWFKRGLDTGQTQACDTFNAPNL